MDRDLLKIENAEIWYKNFSGVPDKFGKSRRTFNVVIRDEELANKLIEDEWPIRAKVFEDADPYYLLQVTVRFDKIPPDVYQIVGNKKIRLDEDSIGNLDHCEIECADIKVSQSKWEIPGRNGVTAYLRQMHVILEDDDFDGKYACYEIV